MHEQGTQVKEQAPFQPGELVEGKYRIERLLAEGGMGAVYQATQEPLGRAVAIKILKPIDGVEAPAKLEERTKRFFREASLCSRLNHPNTVTIFDYGKLGNDQGFYLAMEFLRGGTLRELLVSQGALGVEISLHIAEQIVGSLTDAHRAGVIHRDLKPPNVMLVQRGDDPYFVKVVDFGLIKEVDESADDEVTTDRDMLLGSPLYMAPERFLQSNANTPALDVYAIGIMLYEMLAGRPPFTREGDATLHHVIMKHIQAPPPPLRQYQPHLLMPEGLEQLVMMCLAKEPGERPAMETLGRLLRSCLANVRGEGTGPMPQLVPVSPIDRDSSGPVLPLGPEAPTMNTAQLRQRALQEAMGHPQTAPLARPFEPAQDMAPPSSSKRGLLIGGVVVMALIVVGLIAAMLLGGGAPAQLTLTSAPNGAEVWRGAERLGITPMTLALGPDAQGSPLTIRMAGHEDYLYQPPHDARGAVQLHAVMAALPAPEPPKPAQEEPIQEAPSPPEVKPEATGAGVAEVKPEQKPAKKPDKRPVRKPDPEPKPAGELLLKR